MNIICTCVLLQFKYWSPPPSHPERRVPVDPDTATASCSASSARLAVTGGLHVGWKSSATGPSVVTWQVGSGALRACTKKKHFSSRFVERRDLFLVARVWSGSPLAIASLLTALKVIHSYR